MLLVMVALSGTVSVPVVASVTGSMAHSDVLPQRPVDKIDPRLLNLSDPSEPVNVLVKYRDEIGAVKAASAIETISRIGELRQVYDSLSMASVRIVAGDLPRLARERVVTKIWADEPVHIMSQYPPACSAPSSQGSDNYAPLIDQLGARQLWEQGYNGTGVVVAVLDTGIDFTHPDLDDFDDNESTLDSKVTAYASFVEADTLPVDILGHGTFVASVIGGTGNKSAGLYAGVAPGVSLLAAKVTLGGMLTVPSWVVSGIEWACSRGADIIVIPFNTFGAPGDAISEAVRWAAERGVLVIAAAGDDGPDYLTIMSPGGSREALTIGAYDSQTGTIPSFSGRGPSFEMMAKPDLVAPGVGIVGAKVGAGLSQAGFGGFDLSSVGEISTIVGGTSVGEAIDDYYVIADTTAAAAGVVAGAAAILLQAFDRATPIVVGNVLRDTAHHLPYGANDAGAGLVDLPAAFSYLSKMQSPVEPRIRTTGTPLLATGIVVADSDGATTTALLSSYGTMVAVLRTTDDNTTSIHLMMGTLSLRWNNLDPISLMMFDVEREMHQVYTSSPPDGYSRYVGVISYEDTVFVILVVEAYNLTLTTTQPLTGFKITPIVLNLGQEPITNVSLFLSYSLDLFLDGRDDHGKYALNNQEVFAYGQSEDYENFYFGFNSSRPFGAFEVGNSSDIGDHVTADNLTGSTTFDGTVGLAARWDFGEIAPTETSNVTIVLGFGDNRTMLDASIDMLWSLKPSPQFRQQGDLMVVSADIPRVVSPGQTYHSSAIVMNVGVDPSPVVAAMIVGNVNSSTSGTLFSSFWSEDELAPFHAIRLDAEWTPEHAGIFSVAWVTAPTVASAISLFVSPATTLLASGAGLLDDFLVRDVFVGTPLPSTSVFPRTLPCAPFDLRFPGDFGMFGFMLTTTVPLGNLTIQKYGNATEWGNFSLTPAESVDGYYNFSLIAFVPIITMDGYHESDFVVSTEVGWTTNISLRCVVDYPRSMYFLDSAHGTGFGALGFGAEESNTTSAAGLGGGESGGGIGFPLAEVGSETTARVAAEDRSTDEISLSSLSSVQDLFETLRFTTFSGLAGLKRMMGDAGIDLMELPGMAFSEDLSMFVSGMVILRPQWGFNSTEIEAIRDFGRNGGRLIIAGDTPERANLTSLNEVLSQFGYVMNGTHDAENTTEVAADSLLGHGVDCVWLGGGTFIQNNQSFGQVFLGGRPVILLDESRPEVALFGSSRLFLNSHLNECNNSILFRNLIEYLLTNTLSCETTLAENTTSYPVGRSVFLNLLVRDYYGRPANDLTVVIVFQLPNGSDAYFYAGFVENGLYSSQFAPSYWRDEGRINGIFLILRTEDYAGTFASISFSFYRPPTNPQPTSGGRVLTMPQIATITGVGVFGAVTVGLAWNRARRRRRLRVPIVDETLAQDIDNMLNQLLAAFVQIEELIRQPGMERVEKVETIRGMMDLLHRALEEFERISGRIGGV